MPPPKQPDVLHLLPVDSPERRRLPLLLRRAWYGLNQAFRRRIQHLRVTPDQFTVLRTLNETDRRGVSQRELTTLMSSDPNTVASLVERMEAAGLLKREAHELDRRAHRITLLPLGKQKYAEAREIAVALQSEILKSLPEKKRDDFLLQLSLVAEACRLSAQQSPQRGAAASKE
jgi:DNA-binding MarR family transcriptional regulator